MKCVVFLLMAVWLTPCLVTRSFLTRELSSLKGVCDAQCEALCQEMPDRVNECESLCQPGTPRKWIFNCEHGGDCQETGYCSVLANESLPGLYVPPKPNVKVLRDPGTKDILLHWERDNQTTHKVIYIVQWALTVAMPTEDSWYTYGWTKFPTYFVNETKDACVQPWFRVASVSRYGSRWYSDSVQTPALAVAEQPPGPVRNISTSQFQYLSNTDEITFKLFWMEPRGWASNDIISYYWREHLDQPCLDSISGQGVPVFFDSQTSVVAYSRCQPTKVGQYNSIDVAIDCHNVIGMQCPSIPYNPPGNVQNISLYVHPSQSGLKVEVGWNPPTDLGSEGRVEQYHIRWGRVTYDRFFGIGILYNTDTKTVPGNYTWTTIRLVNSTTNISDPYGVQIIATPPGHGHVDSWLAPVKAIAGTDQSPQQNDWLHTAERTTILKDDNGVVIVLVPKVKGVRVYVTMPEDRANEDLTGFFLHWGRLHNQSNTLSILNKTSLFMLKSDSSVLLEHLQSKREYGLQVVPYCNETDNETIDDADPDAETELHFFTMPLMPESQISEPKQNDLNSVTVTTLAVGLGVIFAMLVVVFVYTKRRRKKLSFLERRYGRTNDGYSNYYDLNGNNRLDFSGLTSPPVVADTWELPHSCLKLGQVLGSGAFGMVLRGQVSHALLRHRGLQLPANENQDRIHVTVAVKMLQEGVDNRYYRDFIQEINLMKNIGYHANVVSMLGCCTLREPICLVVEHMALGDLLQYLKKIRHMLYSQEDSIAHYQNREAEHLSPLDLLSFARQIVRGMEFLSGKFFVHRDLAARNILVDENKVLKIGDFGLTRFIYDDKVYVNRRGGKLPIKWMSVEAIFELTFTTASDVWSYGIVLFELMTLGGTPYPGIANRELLRELRNGYRMMRPDNCSLEMYQLMRDCWKSNPKERPTFTDIGQRIDVMIAECSGQEYLDLQLDESQDYYHVDTSEDEDSVMDLDLATEVTGDIGEESLSEMSLKGEDETSDVASQVIHKRVLVKEQERKQPETRPDEIYMPPENSRNRYGGKYVDGSTSKEIYISPIHTVSSRENRMNLSHQVEEGEFVSILKHISNHSDIIKADGSHDLWKGSVKLKKRSLRGYQKDLNCNGPTDSAEDPIDQTLARENRDRESDSSYSQLEGSDDVFSDPLYTTPYSYLETPGDLECLPSSDSSPTESELSDGFFQVDSLGITFRPKQFRMYRMTSEVSTTSIDSGLPQSPIQCDFTGYSPRSSPEYIPKYTKKQLKTSQTGRTKLRTLTRKTSTGPGLPSVANSDEDLTSSSL